MKKFILLFIAWFIMFTTQAQTGGSANLNLLEYFFNSDPGVGNGTQITLAGTPVIPNFNFVPSISALPDGLNRLFVRTKDDAGYWSHTINTILYKQAAINDVTSNITKAEYFFDTDPGLGFANDIQITAGQNITFNFTSSIGALSNGLHRLFVRTWDATQSRWSLSNTLIFYKQEPINTISSNITKAEYFFDTDPGFGIATDIPVTAGQDITFNFTSSVGALSNGLHRLFVRTWDATQSRWSLSNTLIFYKQEPINTTVSNITKAEYFFDTDPGFGSAIDIPVTTGQDITFNFTSSVGALSNGLHRLFVRTWDATQSRWSLSNTLIFYKQEPVNAINSNITKAEYFFDSDPGFGAANDIPVTAGQAITFNFSGDITSLADGIHRLFVRTWDATQSRWSISNTMVFYKQEAVSNVLPNIVKAEYFIDTDPGFGNATDISVTADQTVAFTINGDIASLATGFHRIYVRTQDENGKWSLTINKLFYSTAPVYVTNANFVKAEYFFDTDPGFGSAVNVPVTAAQNVSFTFAPDISSLTEGFHYFYFRMKDENGRWSLTQYELLYREPLVTQAPLANIVKAEYFFNSDPGFGNATAIAAPSGTAVNISGSTNISTLPNGINMFYVRTLDANGKWSLTTSQLFYKESIINTPAPANIVAAEYFIDNDPGFGNATAINAATPAQQVTFTNINLPVNLTVGMHHLFVRTKDANGLWSITNEQLFYYENTVTQPAAGAITRLEWFWETDPGFGKGNSVTIPAGQTSITNLQFDVPLFTDNATKKNFYVRSLDDWSLTTVVLVQVSNPLPLTLLEFSAKANNSNVLTSWKTTSEINTRSFDVEFSLDGQIFSKIGNVLASGNSNSIKNYSFTHLNPVVGANYYRLKMIDKDGSFKYSGIAKVLFNGGNISAYPNPVSTILSLNINDAGLLQNGLLGTLFSSSGALLQTFRITRNITKIEMQAYAAGNYNLVIKNKNGELIYIHSIIKL